MLVRDQGLARGRARGRAARRPYAFGELPRRRICSRSLLSRTDSNRPPASPRTTDRSTGSRSPRRGRAGAPPRRTTPPRSDVSPTADSRPGAPESDSGGGRDRSPSPTSGVHRGCCRLRSVRPPRVRPSASSSRRLSCTTTGAVTPNELQRLPSGPPPSSAGPMARRGRLPATATAMDRSRARPSWGPARSPLPGTRAGPTERAHALAWAIAGMPAAWSSACARPAQSRDPPPNSVRNS